MFGSMTHWVGFCVWFTFVLLDIIRFLFLFAFPQHHDQLALHSSSKRAKLSLWVLLGLLFHLLTVNSSKVSSSQEEVVL